MRLLLVSLCLFLLSGLLPGFLAAQESVDSALPPTSKKVFQNTAETNAFDGLVDNNQQLVQQLWLERHQQETRRHYRQGMQARSFGASEDPSILNAWSHAGVVSLRELVRVTGGLVVTGVERGGEAAARQLVDQTADFIISMPLHLQSMQQLLAEADAKGKAIIYGHAVIYIVAPVVTGALVSRIATSMRVPVKAVVERGGRIQQLEIGAIDGRPTLTTSQNGIVRLGSIDAESASLWAELDQALQRPGPSGGRAASSRAAVPNFSSATDQGGGVALLAPPTAVQIAVENPATSAAAAMQAPVIATAQQITKQLLPQANKLPVLLLPPPLTKLQPDIQAKKTMQQEQLENELRQYRQLDPALQGLVDFMTWRFLNKPTGLDELLRQMRGAGLNVDKVVAYSKTTDAVLPWGAELIWDAYQDYVDQSAAAPAAPFWYYFFVPSQQADHWLDDLDPNPNGKFRKILLEMHTSKSTNPKQIAWANRETFQPIYRRLLKLFGTDTVQAVFPTLDHFMGFVLVYEAMDTLRVFLQQNRREILAALRLGVWSNERIRAFQRLGFVIDAELVRVPTFFSLSQKLLQWMAEKGIPAENRLLPSLILRTGHYGRYTIPLKAGAAFPILLPIQRIMGGLSVAHIQRFISQGIDPWCFTSHEVTNVLWHDINHTIGRIIDPAYGAAILSAFRAAPPYAEMPAAFEARILFANEYVRTLRVDRSTLWQLLALPTELRHAGQYTVDELVAYLETLSTDELTARGDRLMGILPRLVEHVGAVGNDQVTLSLVPVVFSPTAIHSLTGNSINSVFEEAWRLLYSTTLNDDVTSFEVPNTRTDKITALARMMTYLLQLANIGVNELVHDAIFLDGGDADSAYYQLLFGTGLIDASEIPR